MEKLIRILFTILCFAFLCNHVYAAERCEESADGHVLEKGALADGGRFEACYLNHQLDGPYRTWFASGQPKAEGTYQAGVMNGQWTRWYANGQKQDEGSWHDDKPDGSWKFWGEDGVAKEDIRYNDGVKRAPRIVGGMPWTFRVARMDFTLLNQFSSWYCTNPPCPPGNSSSNSYYNSYHASSPYLSWHPHRRWSWLYVGGELGLAFPSNNSASQTLLTSQFVLGLSFFSSYDFNIEIVTGGEKVLDTGWGTGLMGLNLLFPLHLFGFIDHVYVSVLHSLDTDAGLNGLGLQMKF